MARRLERPRRRLSAALRAITGITDAGRIVGRDQVPAPQDNLRSAHGFLATRPDLILEGGAFYAPYQGAEFLA